MNSPAQATQKTDNQNRPTEERNFLRRPLSEYGKKKNDLAGMVLARQKDESVRLDEWLAKMKTTNSEERNNCYETGEQIRREWVAQQKLLDTYQKNNAERMPCLNKIQNCLGLLCLMSGLMGGFCGAKMCEKTVEAEKQEPVCWGVVVGACLMGASLTGYGVAFRASRRLHYQNIKIRSDLMCWHHLSSCEKRNINLENLDAEQKKAIRWLDKISQKTRV